MREKRESNQARSSLLPFTTPYFLFIQFYFNARGRYHVTTPSRNGIGAARHLLNSIGRPININASSTLFCVLHVRVVPLVILHSIYDVFIAI